MTPTSLQGGPDEQRPQELQLAQRVILLRSNSLVTPRWLYWSLRSHPIQGSLISLATGSTALGIKAERLRNVLMPVPCLEVQHNLVGRLDAMSQTATSLGPKLQRQVALLIERRQSLITAAVSDRLDVTATRGAA